MHGLAELDRNNICKFVVNFLGYISQLGPKALLSAFENQPAKDACQVRYLVTADMSLPQKKGKLKVLQSHGLNACLFGD